MTDVSVGVCGLGNMGLQVARRAAIVASGPAFDISAEARSAAADFGLRPTECLEDMRDCDVVVLSLPRAEISLSVVETLASVLHEGAIVVETSTVGPENVSEMNALLSPKGIRLIDAAIVTGVPAMATGTSSMVVGAKEMDVPDLVRAIFESMTAEVKWVGTLGAAMALKVIHNAVAHATMVTLSEARALGAPYGIDEMMLVDVLKGEGAGLLRPLLHRLGERVPAKNYAGGMALSAAFKDSHLVLEMAQRHNVDLYTLYATHSAYEAAETQFDGRCDYAVLAELWGEKDGSAAE